MEIYKETGVGVFFWTQCRYARLLLLGNIALMQVILPTATHFSIVWSVICLSVVRHIRASLL